MNECAQTTIKLGSKKLHVRARCMNCRKDYKSEGSTWIDAYLIYGCRHFSQDWTKCSYWWDCCAIDQQLTHLSALITISGALSKQETTNDHKRKAGAVVWRAWVGEKCELQGFLAGIPEICILQVEPSWKEARFWWCDASVVSCAHSSVNVAKVCLWGWYCSGSWLQKMCFRSELLLFCFWLNNYTLVVVCLPVHDRCVLLSPLLTSTISVRARCGEVWCTNQQITVKRLWLTCLFYL